MSLKDWYWRRWIRQHGCKVSTGVSAFGKRARLTLEGDVRLGDVEVSVATLEVLGVRLHASRSAAWYL